MTSPVTGSSEIRVRGRVLFLLAWGSFSSGGLVLLLLEEDLPLKGAGPPLPGAAIMPEQPLPAIIMSPLPPPQP
eukprot:CAMPEP_0178451942 /NCGR_PEP_ID=MMETSP0689_2-20121128/43964_1 /TAXON_ID=160604 /ORGANISM="Amphidinium massartii, Strain CS-259" /LENGTH=73 /DNA_ID=CAMNT_0020077583 /DNA_START=227 /DNA_END=448 /DNA_ORIENTATION=+